MKLVLVNLVGSGVQDAVNRFSQHDIDQVRDLAVHNKIIFYCLNERWNTEYINNSLKVFFDNFDNENLLLICDRLTTKEEIDRLIIKKVVQTDSQLLKTAQWETYTTFNKTINLETGKFLFLMGKPYKPNRLPLLYKISKKGLIDKCDYSFYYAQNYSDRTREVMNFLSAEEYDNFVKSTVNVLDNIIPGIDYDFFDYCGFPVDQNLYKNTSFSVVSESAHDLDNCHFISEKTWRTIANRHMFITVLPRQSIEFLHSLGLKTFDYCLKYTKNDMTDNIDDLLDKVVENIEYALSNIEKYKLLIRFDIEHNYYVYKKLVDAQRNKVRYNIEKYLNIYPHIDDNNSHLKIFDIDKKLQNSIDRIYKED